MFTLPQRNFNFNDFEPIIDTKTMEIHFTKHHQAYVDNLNKLTEGSEFNDMNINDLLRNIEKISESIRQGVVNNAGGHANHTFFWNLLTKYENSQEELNDSLEIFESISETFDSLDNFKSLFVDGAMKRFGSGWMWLVKNKDGELELYSTANQDSPIMKGDNPIFGIDVWEHAYYLNYQNKRADYLTNIWNIISWNKVNENFTA